MINHIATPYPMSAKTRYSVRSAPHFAALAIMACVALSGCSTQQRASSSLNPVNWLTPYKVDVIQGNFISKEQVEALKPGMPRTQVKDILGTPLVASVFHADRWDYVFTLKRQGVEPQSYRYAVYFKGDQLERFEGDTMPSEAEFIAKLDNSRKFGKVPVLEATEEQLKAAEKSSVRSTSSSASTASTANRAGSGPAGVPATVYPPLESPKQ
ncbi:MAG: SmpA/OmlA domain protein [Polaromonas sp.]|jgi:outer membrane protein assembly factor BamE|nr:SmpA/OmlA domain protein [Polaromonas sp.]